MFRASIFGVMILVAYSAFAEQEKPKAAHSGNAASPEWERAREGLKKAKPMPQPSNNSGPKTTTPNGGVSGFDAKTGRATSSSPAEPPTANESKHSAKKRDVQPKSAGREKRE